MDGEWGDGAAVSPSTASGGEGSVGAGDGVSADCPPGSSPVAPATTGRRRSASKRVVTVPLADVSGPRPNKGAGEGNTSIDEWAWRKYGQKPIKGSPFPRAYYRCSSSKGCPARKQVERSRVEPDKVIVAYSFEHNHSGAAPRVQSRQAPKPKARPVPPEPAAASLSIGTHDVVVAGALATEGGVDVPDDDFRWLYDGVSVTSSSTSPSDADAADDMLFGPVFFLGAAISAPAPLPDEFGDVGALFGGEAAEEDAMFAGLGELPECATVFQRRAVDGLALAGGVEVEQPAEGTTAMT